MGHTYGESWAFFYDKASTPSIERPDTADLGDESQDIPAARVARPQVAEQIVPSNAAMLAEIRKLQQELDDIRSQQPEITPERTAQDLQQSSAPPDQPLDSNDRSTAELPRCWDPCCNGRTFSNNSNLARHQREKREGSAKLRCSFCGTGFSRSSARNAHEAERRCRKVARDVVH